MIPARPRRDELVKLLQFSDAKQSTTKLSIISPINFKKIKLIDFYIDKIELNL